MRVRVELGFRVRVRVGVRVFPSISFGNSSLRLKQSRRNLAVLFSPVSHSIEAWPHSSHALSLLALIECETGEICVSVSVEPLSPLWLS